MHGFNAFFCVNTACYHKGFLIRHSVYARVSCFLFFSDEFLCKTLADFIVRQMTRSHKIHFIMHTDKKKTKNIKMNGNHAVLAAETTFYVLFKLIREYLFKFATSKMF